MIIHFTMLNSFILTRNARSLWFVYCIALQEVLRRSAYIVAMATEMTVRHSNQ